MTGAHVRCTMIFELVDADVVYTAAELAIFKQQVVSQMLPRLAYSAGVITREHINAPEQLVELGLEIPVPF